MNEHVKFTQSWIRQICGKKHSIKTSTLITFLRNTELVSNGHRVGFAPERVVLPDEVLLKLLQEILPRLNVAINPSEICVLKINDHTIVCNVDNCLTRLEAIIDNSSETCPSIMNISANNEPSILSRDNLDKTIIEACQRMRNSMVYPEHTGEVRLLTMSAEQVNICTIFGIVLGYPVIYYFDDIENGSNCLSMTPLVVVKMHDVTSQTEIFSFSYPQCLQHDLKSVVDEWILPFTKDKSILIKNEIVTLPCVTL